MEIMPNLNTNNLLFEYPYMVSFFDFIIDFDLDNMKDLKQKRDITETLIENNTYLEVSNSLKIEKQPLGTILKEFLNNFEKIDKLLRDYINIIEYACITTSKIQFNPPELLLKKFCKELQNSLHLKFCFPLIQNEMYKFIKKDLPLKISLFKDASSTIIDKPNFYQNEYLSFTKKFLNNMQDLYQVAKNSFKDKEVKRDSSKEPKPEDFEENSNTSTSRFSVNNLTIPTATLKFNIENTIRTFQYTYQIQTIEDLLNITIYHLALNNNVLSMCKYCNKFFIPIRNNKIYCTDTIWGTKKNGENITCEYKAKESYHKVKENEYIKEYNKIYKKIKKATDSKTFKNTKKLEDLLEKLKKDYKNICKTYQYDKNNPEFLKKLDKIFSQTNENYNRFKANAK